MITPLELPVSNLEPFKPATFAAWRGHLDRKRVSPVVGIAGSRGKTSVLRAAEAIFTHAGLRAASRSSGGVDIEGESQRGEITPWARALTRLRTGGLDVALHEIDWVTAQVMNATDMAYPVLAITNLCGNNNACLATPEIQLAHKALARIKAGMPVDGQLVLNAHDFALADHDGEVPTEHYLIGMTPDAPMLRRHLARGGNACYLHHQSIMFAEGGDAVAMLTTDDVPALRHGSVPFEMQNVLMAAAITRACGLSVPRISSGLAAYEPHAARMPGSFNVFDLAPATVIIDRPMPSWFLRSSIRAAVGLGCGRQIRVVGPMLDVPTEDVNEIGRLLGRQSGAIIMHGDWPYERLGLFKLGVAMNDVPPVMVHAADERGAVLQGLDMLRAGDVLLVLAESAPAAVRLVSARQRRLDQTFTQPAGAA